ncbi:MAG: RsmE family RNA methyltransferase, partial [Actinomycetota bacterium]
MSPSGPDSPAAADAVAHVIVDDPADELVVDGAAGHHLVRVRRLRTGEAITAADGAGIWREYRVTAATAEGLVASATGPVRHEPAPRVGIAVAVALTKGGLEDVVTAVTELGAVRIVPLVTERVVVRWDADRADRAVARLSVAARAAVEQSRRSRLPIVDPVTSLSDRVGRAGLVVAARAGLPAPALVP